MLKKKFRLKQNQVKKVLNKGKPFFSYGIVLKFLKNNLDYSRFAIVIHSKCVENSVNRVFFRRKFYDFLNKKPFFEKKNDFVFLVKKQNKLSKKNNQSIINFLKDLDFLLKKTNF